MNNNFRLKRALLVTIFCLFFTLTASAQLKETGKVNAWTRAEVTKVGEVKVTDGSGLLVNVRAARNKGFDRVVFEFKEKPASFQVKAAKPPFYLGESDEKVKVAGKSFVQVLFRYARAWDFDTGKSTLTAQKGKLNLPVVQETAFTEDFEGDVVFIIGLKQAKQFRVTELSNPARIVVDFKH